MQMYSLYTDPKGEKIFIKPDLQKHSKPGTTVSSQLGTCVGNNIETVVDVHLKESVLHEHKEVEVSLSINPI